MSVIKKGSPWCRPSPGSSMNFLLLAIVLVAGLLPGGAVGEKSKRYQMSDICSKQNFMRDVYRKIEGAVLTSQDERQLDCVITFQTHSILQRFMLRFDQLQLDCNDHLYIFDGAHIVDHYKVDLSCRNTKQTVGAIYTRTNFVTLKYVTDAWGTNRNGFSLVITAVKEFKHTCKDFRCTQNKFCIATDLLCDGVNHCGDSSDETSTLCSNTEASTILGIETTWFAVILVFLILSTAGLVAVGVLCFCRQRVATPRHPQNAHNAQTHPPANFPWIQLSSQGPYVLLALLIVSPSGNSWTIVCWPVSLQTSDIPVLNIVLRSKYWKDQLSLTHQCAQKSSLSQFFNFKAFEKLCTVWFLLQSSCFSIFKYWKNRFIQSQSTQKSFLSQLLNFKDSKKLLNLWAKLRSSWLTVGIPHQASRCKVEKRKFQRWRLNTETQCSILLAAFESWLQLQLKTRRAKLSNSRGSERCEQELQLWQDLMLQDRKFPLAVSTHHQWRPRGFSSLSHSWLFSCQPQPTNRVVSYFHAISRVSLIFFLKKIHWKMSKKVIFTLMLVSVLMCLISFSSAINDQSYKENSVTYEEFVSRDFFVGPCLVNTQRTCPDPEVSFYLYTRFNPTEGQEILVNNTGSNLGDTNFLPFRPTKIVVHGYNSDMQLYSLVDIRREYLKNGEYNLVALDWHRLAVSPCYPVAVHNLPHVGDCLAQLIERMRDFGASDIHVIGFSLGAHVPAFAANVLRPNKIQRITGLDPAMPLFVTVNKDEKLDAGDADFVDVFHTNAFVQGKLEPSGHIDFYMNGGINQPGCWEKKNPFGCDHHRSAEYFSESINSEVGFWGWPCSGFVAYLLGLCPPTFPEVLAGDKVDKNSRGFHLVKTNAQSPYAKGMFPVNLRDMHQ
ncbi:uncharacterized protein [Prorops nasuta]|uniref:uncharacterized protein n=1 Tax=Prorops nasuta TaxID=863751 RepID=UPI0034CFC446